MPVFKCKSCGAPLDIASGQAVATCEYCGMAQTLPRLNDDKRADMYDRANHFRRANDYDKAMAIYEQILNGDKTDAEAYWSIVLCRYGIEYVEDPATKKRMPTVNRAQFTPIYADEDYKCAIRYADAERKQVYEAEAAVIDGIQKGILDISRREKPFDVFICYKETDANGRRTPDSVLANDIYHELTREGYKVFFSRITLEDKLGTAYEPYIFAALNSAKVMVALGTKKEYFSAVWVKNEWSRFLALIRAGQKKVLIPAYRDMDPYDLPEEFSHLQALDMHQLGFMQDLIRGIKKLTQQEEAKSTARETVVVQGGSTSNVTQLIKRGKMALSDGNWEKADQFFDQALNQDAENGEAYLGQFLAEQQCATLEVFRDKRLAARKVVARVTKVATEPDKARIDAFAKRAMDRFADPHAVREAFRCDLSYASEAAGRSEQLDAEKKYFATDRLWNRALSFAGEQQRRDMESTAASVTDAIAEKLSIATQADEANIRRIREEYERFLSSKEQEFISRWETEKERRQENADRVRAARKKVITQRRWRLYTFIALEVLLLFFWVIRPLLSGNGFEGREYFLPIAVIVFAAILYITKIDAAWSYSSAEKLLKAGKYDEALEAYKQLGDYKDAARQVKEVEYRQADELLRDGQYNDAAEAFAALGGYRNASEMVPECLYRRAGQLMAERRYEDAYTVYSGLQGYRDTDRILETDDNIREAAFADKCRIRQIVPLGSYAGREIKWIVLETTRDTVLLLAQQGIDALPYHTEKIDVTWEKCWLREWLNGQFYDTAFTDRERAMIIRSTVINPDNPGYATEGGGNTQDYVYLLSLDDAARYLDNDGIGACGPTEQARGSGAYVSEDGAGWWWLRSPGACGSMAATVDCLGNVMEEGNSTVNPHISVRPVILVHAARK